MMMTTVAASTAGCGLRRRPTAHSQASAFPCGRTEIIEPFNTTHRIGRRCRRRGGMHIIGMIAIDKFARFDVSSGGRIDIDVNVYLLLCS